VRDYALILAADLPSRAEVTDIAKKVGGVVDGIKLAAATLMEFGVSVVKDVRDAVGDIPILIDLKIADIGFYSGKSWDGTNSKIIRSLAGSGATHVTVHGFPGPLSIAEAVYVGRECGIGVLLLPLMSHAGGGLFFGAKVDQARLEEETDQAGIVTPFPSGLEATDATEGILLYGEIFGVEGYIAPATRPDDLKRYREFTSRRLWCPGFGRQDRLGRSLKEQFLQWGGIVGCKSAAIVGSAIFKAKDPADAAKDIAEIRDSVQSELKGR
jgi:orotidine-5'-phosphate decarboxylase